MAIDWDSPLWGVKGHNTHVASSGNYGPGKGNEGVSDQ